MSRLDFLAPLSYLELISREGTFIYYPEEPLRRSCYRLREGPSSKTIGMDFTEEQIELFLRFLETEEVGETLEENIGIVLIADVLGLDWLNFHCLDSTEVITHFYSKVKESLELKKSIQHPVSSRWSNLHEWLNHLEDSDEDDYSR